MNKRIVNLVLLIALILGGAWLSPTASAKDGVVTVKPEDVSTQTTVTGTEPTVMPSPDKPKILERLEVQGKQTKPLSETEAAKLSTEKKDALIQEIKDQNENRKEQKLDDAKKKICENKKEGITNSMDKIGQTGKKHGDWLGSVTEKVKAFITKNNLTIDNYDTLVANIDNSKAAVDAAVQTLETYKGQFDCSADPKAVSSDFQTAVDVLKSAMKTYKESLKSLLDATKTAATAAGIAPAVKSNSSNTTGGAQ